MSEAFPGTFYDGTSGVAHAATLRRIGGAHFALEGAGIARSGDVASLSVTPRLARIARAVEFPDGARLLIAHDADIDAWFPRPGRLEALVDRMERHAHVVALAMVVCAAALVVGATWGLPWLADRIVETMPPDVERALGEEVLGSLDALGLKPSGLDADRRAALSARFARLAHAAGGDYRLEFRDAPAIGPNAFAVPGGTIVVSDQLVGVLGDDREFDAVVAHEIGHQRHRHALRQALRGSLVAIAAALFTGDVSSAGAVVVAVPTFLLDNHYSRGFEDEADREAFELLARANESPHWFAAAITEIESKQPDNEEPMAYLSSHPSAAERIGHAEAAAVAFAAAHPDLCPNGVCPGEGDETKGEGDDDAAAPPPG